MSEERYDILKLLGKGRTGGVYEAEDTRLGRKVAMRRFFSQSDYIKVSDYEDEFKAIAQSLSALQHPNLLRVFDAGMDEDGAFIISQLLKGDTLHNRLKEGALSNWDVWDLGHQMLDALSASHDGGFVHGAITPGSILMSPRARGGYLYVILDMGLSRLAPLIQGKDSFLSSMADPAILAPELFDGSEATEKSDLYMLGNILYMCLAGGHPFGGKTLEECSELHKQGLPELAEFAPDAPQDLLEWTAKLYEIDPENRPASVVEALQTMPKVAKPAKAGISPINTAPGLSPITATSTLTAHPTAYGNPVSGGLLTGPLTTGAGVATQTTHGQLLNKYQQPKKSYKGLIITVASLVLLGLGLYFIMNGKDEKTGEQIAADKAKKQDSEKPADTPAPKPTVKNVAKIEEVITFTSSGGKLDAKGWKTQWPQFSKNTANGWTVKGAKGKNTGIKKLITATDIEDMFKKGWLVRYEVNAIKAAHTMGFHFSADENLFWLNNEKPVGVVMTIQNTGDAIVLNDGVTKSNIAIEGANKNFFTIELRGKPNDRSGSYELLINGQLIEQFKGKFSQKEMIDPVYRDQLFSASGNPNATDSNWVIRELSLSVGTAAE